MSSKQLVLMCALLLLACNEDPVEPTWLIRVGVSDVAGLGGAGSADLGDGVPVDLACPSSIHEEVFSAETVPIVVAHFLPDDVVPVGPLATEAHTPCDRTVARGIYDQRRATALLLAPSGARCGLEIRGGVANSTIQCFLVSSVADTSSCCGGTSSDGEGGGGGSQ